MCGDTDFKTIEDNASWMILALKNSKIFKMLTIRFWLYKFWISPGKLYCHFSNEVYDRQSHMFLWNNLFKKKFITWCVAECRNPALIGVLFLTNTNNFSDDFLASYLTFFEKNYHFRKLFLDHELFFYFYTHWSRDGSFVKHLVFHTKFLAQLSVSSITRPLAQLKMEKNRGAAVKEKPGVQFKHRENRLLTRVPLPFPPGSKSKSQKEFMLLIRIELFCTNNGFKKRQIFRLESFVSNHYSKLLWYQKKKMPLQLDCATWFSRFVRQICIKQAALKRFKKLRIHDI